MKLFLISTILLLAALLTFAGRPFRRPSRVAKWLWDSDHIIGQGYDISQLHFKYNGDQLTFFASKYMRTGVQQLTISEKNLLKQNLSFSLELFGYPNFSGQRPGCLRDASKSLEHLIVTCRGLIVLRELKPEEKIQIEQFKQKQKLTNQTFKIVFNGKDLWHSQSFGLRELEVQGYQKETGYYNYTNALEVNTIEHSYDRIYNPYKFTNMHLLNNSIPTRSFVIEAHPFPLKDDCYLTKLKDLRPTDCFGNVTIRAKTDDDN